MIGLEKLRTKFKQYEAKRQLLNMYDLFIADDRILPLLRKLLGVKFFERKKCESTRGRKRSHASGLTGVSQCGVNTGLARFPVPVNLRSEDVVAELGRARNSLYLYPSPGSTRCAARPVAPRWPKGRRLTFDQGGCPTCIARAAARSRRRRRSCRPPQSWTT